MTEDTLWTESFFFSNKKFLGIKNDFDRSQKARNCPCSQEPDGKPQKPWAIGQSALLSQSQEKIPSRLNAALGQPNKSYKQDPKCFQFVQCFQITPLVTCLTKSVAYFFQLNFLFSITVLKVLHIFFLSSFIETSLTYDVVLV